jgi:hypothetical protein
MVKGRRREPSPPAITTAFIVCSFPWTAMGSWGKEQRTGRRVRRARLLPVSNLHYTRKPVSRQAASGESRVIASVGDRMLVNAGLKQLETVSVQIE